MDDFTQLQALLAQQQGGVTQQDLNNMSMNQAATNIMQVVQPQKKTSIADAILQNKYLQQGFDSLQGQKAGLAGLQEQIGAMGKGFEAKTDLSPFLLGADILSGSNYAQNYKRPETAEENKMKQLGLQMQLQKQNDSYSDKQIDLFKAQAGFDNDAAKLKAMERIAAGKSAGKDEKSKFWDAADQEFGKNTYADWVAAGGAEGVQSNIELLGGIKQRLESEQNLTGPGISAQPDFLRKRLYPESTAIQEDVEGLVQNSLKQILGGQYTQKEGENVLKRAYNPALPQAVNAERIQRLMTKFGEAAKAKQEAVEWASQNGTLRGFTKNTNFKSSDFYMDSPASSKKASGGSGKAPMSFEDWKKSKGM